MKIVLMTGLLMLAGGCAATPTESVPAPVPAPSDLQFSINADINFPAQLSLVTGYPPTVKITLDVTAHSEVVSATPLSSHHEGQLSLIVMDGQGKRSFANVNIKVKGDSAGSPDEAIGNLFGQFFQAGGMMWQSIPKGSGPTTQTSMELNFFGK